MEQVNDYHCVTMCLLKDLECRAGTKKNIASGSPKIQQDQMVNKQDKKNLVLTFTYRYGLLDLYINWYFKLRT